jgi:hypothetical protein
MKGHLELEEYWIGEDFNNPAVSYNKMAGGGLWQIKPFKQPKKANER